MTGNDAQNDVGVLDRDFAEEVMALGELEPVHTADDKCFRELLKTSFASIKGRG